MTSETKVLETLFVCVCVCVCVLCVGAHKYARRPICGVYHLSPRHDASSGCGCKRLSSITDVGCCRLYWMNNREHPRRCSYQRGVRRGSNNNTPQKLINNGLSHFRHIRLIRPKKRKKRRRVCEGIRSDGGCFVHDDEPSCSIQDEVTHWRHAA
jgi:hypothetical protein